VRPLPRYIVFFYFNQNWFPVSVPEVYELRRSPLIEVITLMLITLLASIMILYLKQLILEIRLQINNFVDITFFWNNSGVPCVEILSDFIPEHKSQSHKISYVYSLYVASISKNFPWGGTELWVNYRRKYEYLMVRCCPRSVSLAMKIDI
jgi:hypothetical protein